MVRLAAGAMAEVWTDPVRPGIVRKQIRSDQASNPVFRHQLRVEAEALRRSRHDAVVRLAGDGPDGLWLERCAPLEPPADAGAARTLVLRVAAALDAAHAAGVVHRDVKLGNVLASPRGPVLADFGCARIDGWPDPAPGLGTPAAMSPRRLAGAPATPADDRWALGVLAWTLCCGAPPFPGSRWAEATASVARGLPAFRPVLPAFDEAELRRWFA